MYVKNLMNTTNDPEIPGTTSINTITLGNEFARTMNQFTTSIEDIIENQVNNRPSIQMVKLRKVQLVAIKHQFCRLFLPRKPVGLRGRWLP